MESRKTERETMELLIQDISQRIENLKLQFNLFFSGEVRVPPEKEREELEKRIRNLMITGDKTPRINLMIQNVASRFSLYNNLWLKRLNELETGISVIKRKKPAYGEEPQAPPKPKSKVVTVSLNSEESFDKFFNDYVQLTAKKSDTIPDKEQVINSLKAKMITANVIDAKVDLSVEKGKLKVRIKGSQ
jgi:hypothetical protein